MARARDEMLRLNAAEEKAEAKHSEALAEQQAAGEEVQASGQQMSAARAAYIAADKRWEAAQGRAMQAARNVAAARDAHLLADGLHTELARKWFQHNEQASKARHN